MSPKLVSNVLGLAGAAVGGLVGVLGYFWMMRQGFYALVLPTGLVGVGCSLLARHPSRARGVACALAGLVLGFVCEWKSTLGWRDEGLGAALGHLKDFGPVTWLMLGLGTALSFSMGGGPGRGGLGPVTPR